MIKIRELEAFIHVVQQGGIVKAADQMFCVPSNISKLISDLESRCKQPLFNRRGRELTLTPFGRYFYAQSIKFLEDSQEFTNINFESKNAKLFIGGLDIALDYFIPEKLYQYKLKNPNIDFEVYRDYSNILEEKVFNNSYDVVFSDGPIVSTRLNSKLAFEERLVLVKNIEISGKEIIVYSFGENCSYKNLIKLWARKNLKKFRIVEIESYPLMLNLISNQMGISLIPLSIMHQHENFKYLIDVNQFIKCDIYMIWNKLNDSGHIANFIENFLLQNRIL